jgi:hypothetical protein
MSKKEFMGINPKHKGYCTPMTKSTCTPKRKALAKTLKKHHGFHKKAEGGLISGDPIYDKHLLEFAKKYGEGGFMPLPREDDNPYSNLPDDPANPANRVDNSGIPLPAPNIDFQGLINQKNNTKSPYGKGIYSLPMSGHGDYFTTAGMHTINSINAETPAQGIGQGISAGKDFTKGIAKAVGDTMQNRYTKNYDNNQLFSQLDGSLRDGFSNFTPNDLHGEMKQGLFNAYGGTIKYGDGGNTQTFDNGSINKNVYNHPVYDQNGEHFATYNLVQNNKSPQKYEPSYTTITNSYNGLKNNTLEKSYTSELVKKQNRPQNNIQSITQPFPQGDNTQQPILGKYEVPKMQPQYPKYFSRPKQDGESGEMEYFDAKTGKPLQFHNGGKIKYDTGGEIEENENGIPKEQLSEETLPSITNKLPKMFNVNDFRTTRRNSNSEIEGGETIQSPEGLINDMQGPKHEQGGIPVNAPNTKVLSDRLKFQFMPNKKEKSFAEEAKKYSTESDVENLNNKYADSIERNTANLNLKIKNEKVDNIYNIQQAFKMHNGIGEFKGMKKAVGGFISKYKEGGKTLLKGNEVNNDGTYYGQNPNIIPYNLNVNNNVSPTNPFNIEETNNVNVEAPFQRLFPTITGQFGPTGSYENVDHIYQDAIAKGYKGAKDIASLQNWMASTYPKQTAEYMGHQPMTDFGVKLYGAKGEAFNDPYYKNPIGSNYTDNQKLAGFKDGLWDYRFPNINELKDETVTPTTPVSPNDKANFNVNKIKGTSGQKSNGMNFNGLPFPVMNTYQEDPLQTSQLNPHLINYRPTDIEPAIAEANRGFRVTTKGLDTSPMGLANSAQSFANTWRAKQGIYSDNFNRAQQGKIGVDEFNARELSAVDQQNLQERNRFMDLINKGKGVIDSQKRFDANASTQNMYNANAYNASAKYIQDVYGNSPNSTFQWMAPGMTAPYNASADVTNTTSRNAKGEVSTKTVEKKKYGGMLKKKLKK